MRNTSRCSWARQQRGVSVVTYALILPLFILTVFGILEIWRLMSVRESLSQGVYDAARHLSEEGYLWRLDSADHWESDATARARETIAAELQRNVLVPAGSRLHVQVSIEPEARQGNLRALGWLFTVRADLALPDPVRLPVLRLGAVSMTERLVSYVEGRTGSWSPPR